MSGRSHDGAPPRRASPLASGGLFSIPSNNLWPTVMDDFNGWMNQNEIGFEVRDVKRFGGLKGELEVLIIRE